MGDPSASPLLRDDMQEKRLEHKNGHAPFTDPRDPASEHSQTFTVSLTVSCQAYISLLSLITMSL